VAEMYTGEVTFQNDSVVTMLSRIEAICGSFPRHIIANGRQTGQFFTGSGLIYERASANEESERQSDTDEDEDDTEFGGNEPTYHVYQPKVTKLAARLGYHPDLMEKAKEMPELRDKALFVDFLRCVLTIDPDLRPSAKEALQHPWILSCRSLTDKDIKYPPE